MKEEKVEVRFGGEPSKPRAARLVRLLMYLVLLGIACGAIWWIDRGVGMTNGGA